VSFQNKKIKKKKIPKGEQKDEKIRKTVVESLS